MSYNVNPANLDQQLAPGGKTMEVFPSTSQEPGPANDGGSEQHQKVPAPVQARQDGGSRSKEKADSEDESASQINVDHLNLDFEECFREPKSTKTHPVLHKVIRFIYHYTKQVIYHVLILLLGLVFAFIYAIVNGICSFVLIWIWGPALKLVLAFMYSISPVFTGPCSAIFAPMVDVVGRLFRQLRIRIL